MRNGHDPDRFLDKIEAAADRDASPGLVSLLGSSSDCTIRQAPPRRSGPLPRALGRHEAAPPLPVASREHD